MTYASKSTKEANQIKDPVKRKAKLKQGQAVLGKALKSLGVEGDQKFEF